MATGLGQQTDAEVSGKTLNLALLLLQPADKLIRQQTALENLKHGNVYSQKISLLLKVWLGLITKNTGLELGKDHVLA